MMGKQFFSGRAFEKQDFVGASIRMENGGGNDEGGVGYTCGKEVGG